MNWTVSSADIGIWLTHYDHVLEICSLVIACLILGSGLDDVFIDLWFWIRLIYRRLTVWRTNRPLSEAQLFEREEQPLAIMVPAWKEYDVIAAMIENLVRVLNYRSYVIFVGTYPNDTATITEVERMRRRYKQLRRVEVPHDGPTCKADCLNWVIQDIQRYEESAGIPFAGVILHDSEDVVHPLELRFFNYLLPRKDMIQLPVMSLERRCSELVAGTYMDEFAEWHTKDLVVRESMAGNVPSAGVGTCFSRRALQALLAGTDNQPFNTQSLTEDYDIGHRLGEMGMSSIFARFLVDYTVRRKSWFGWGKERDLTIRAPLCVREFFPNTFRTAYRQRARWTLGIGLQGWQQMGWTGGLAQRYLLFRDRKGIVTAFVGIVAYVLVVQFGLLWIANRCGLMPAPTSIYADWPIARLLLWTNLVLLVIRGAQRFYFVTRLYGWEHGLVSLPRMVVGNCVNFMAVARAWRMFIEHLATGKRLVWDKTMHDFPSADGFVDRHQSLGELLMSWQIIDSAKLEESLADSHAQGTQLGRTLIERGWLDEDTLAEALAFQAGLERGHVDWVHFAEHTARLPEDMIIRYRVLPNGSDSQGRAVLLVTSALEPAVIADLQQHLEGEIVQKVVREGEIAAGLRRLRAAEFGGEVEIEERVPLLGDLLVKMGRLSREAVDATLVKYRPSRHGAMGDYLVEQGVIRTQDVADAIQLQREMRAATVVAQ